MHLLIVCLVVAFIGLLYFFVVRLIFFSKTEVVFLFDRVVLRLRVFKYLSFRMYGIKYASIETVRKYDRQLDKWRPLNLGTNRNPGQWVVIFRKGFNSNITMGIEEPDAFIEELRKKLG